MSNVLRMTPEAKEDFWKYFRLTPEELGHILSAQHRERVAVRLMSWTGECALRRDDKEVHLSVDRNGNFTSTLNNRSVHFNRKLARCPRT